MLHAGGGDRGLVALLHEQLLLLLHHERELRLVLLLLLLRLRLVLLLLHGLGLLHVLLLLLGSVHLLCTAATLPLQTHMHAVDRTELLSRSTKPFSQTKNPSTGLCPGHTCAAAMAAAIC